MGDSCCICGLILATDDSDFPQWCKDIRALCRIESKPLVSGTGHLDSDFNLPISLSENKRFCYRRTETDEDSDYCYPFHAACWTLLNDSDDKGLLSENVETLFTIFESFHYSRDARSLKWGHNFYIEDMLDSYLDQEDRPGCREDILAANKADLAILVDPLHFTFPAKLIPVQQQEHLRLPWDATSAFSFAKTGLRRLFNSIQQSDLAMTTRSMADFPRYSSCINNNCCTYTGLEFLPTEIVESIMYSLDFHDTQHLLQASPMIFRRYSRDPQNLPSSFWESRFWVHGETAFARSIRPSFCSWKDWFFIIKSELRNGLNKMNLRNRRRIWQLGVNLVTLVDTVAARNRVLYGNVVAVLPDQIRGSVTSCLASKYDSDGCRELRQIYVPFDNEASGLRTVSASYVTIAHRRLVSGLIFTFGDGMSVYAGYVVGKPSNYTGPVPSPKNLSLVSTPLGFEAIGLGESQELLHGCANIYGDRFAVTKWALEGLEGVYLGLDALRIVRICMQVSEQESIVDTTWTPPYPSLAPTICKDNLFALRKLQRISFAPASTFIFNWEKKHLVAIKIYTPLGYHAGITGMQFVYDGSPAIAWGSIDNVASLTFFLDKTEHVTKVTAYEIDSLVCHLQFTTSLYRTSGPLPQLPVGPNVTLQAVDYTASNGGYIIGFCGCFVESFKQLNCFGVVSSTMATSSKSWVPINNYPSISHLPSHLREMPLGDFGNHGQHQSRLLLHKEYQSIEASVNPATSRYRRAGQVTGLLFRSKLDRSHPDFLGQWTGPGESYDLNDGEQIIDLEVVTCPPRLRQPARPGLSQVNSIAVVTNLRKITWGPKNLHNYRELDVRQGTHRATEAFWDFNAVFDRVYCV